MSKSRLGARMHRMEETFPERNRRPIRIRSPKHREFVASLPCMVCGRRGCHAAHIRLGDGGMGLKPGDDRAVPLCAPGPDHEGCHAIQHRNERQFWLERVKNLEWPVNFAYQLLA